MADSSVELLRDLKSGEAEAAARIHARYVARLTALTRKRISTNLQRRIDPEDVLQSAWRSFFLHAREGAYHVQRDGDLWRLLTGIVRHKLLANVERHQAARRSLAREAEPAVDGSSPVAVSREPLPEEDAALAEVWGTLREGLLPDEVQVFDLRLANHTIEEIAQAIGRSERTVRRWLEGIKTRLARTLGQASPQD